MSKIFVWFKKYAYLCSRFYAFMSNYNNILRY